MEKLKEINDNNESVIRNAQAREIIDVLRGKNIPYIKLVEGETPEIVIDMENKSNMSFSLEDVDTQEKLANFLSLIKAKITRDEEGQPKISYMRNGNEFEINI